MSLKKDIKLMKQESTRVLNTTSRIRGPFWNWPDIRVRTITDIHYNGSTVRRKFDCRCSSKCDRNMQSNCISLATQREPNNPNQYTSKYCMPICYRIIQV